MLRKISVTKKTGFKIAPGDVNGISERLRWCSENPDELIRMAAECQPIVTLEAQAEKIETAYTTLISRGVRVRNVSNEIKVM